jgi:hypothetical protein
MYGLVAQCLSIGQVGVGKDKKVIKVTSEDYGSEQRTQIQNGGRIAQFFLTIF